MSEQDKIHNEKIRFVSIFTEENVMNFQLGSGDYGIKSPVVSINMTEFQIKELKRIQEVFCAALDEKLRP